MYISELYISFLRDGRAGIDSMRRSHGLSAGLN